MTFAEALAAVTAAPADPDALDDLARAAMAEGEEERALDRLLPAARQAGRNPLLWQWSGLLARALERHDVALAAFERAVANAPGDAGIAHGHARVAMEAGAPAVALFARARQLAPNDAGVLLGEAAARFAVGEIEAAIGGLEPVVAANPGWIEGHDTIAQLRALAGDRAHAFASYDRALAVAPRHPPLWHGLVALHIRGEDYRAALATIARARAALGPNPDLDAQEAIARGETGDLAGAERLYALPHVRTAPGMAVWRVRHLLRAARLDEASKLVEVGPEAADGAMWPYAAITWRLTGDPRLAWLEGDPRLVSVVDLADRLPSLERVAEVLRGIHRARGAHLDQSVRGGTQTDGPLFARIDPEIRALRAAVVEAVAQHVAQLPPPDARHPTLSKRRDRAPRFAGSWSVRLVGQGHHVNHVHPQGWISSALYVALPEAPPDGGAHAGWLTIGSPQAALGLDLPPTRMIEPKPGRLVLFPSTMWHGTVPFPAGERLTVAFDVLPPI
ncbi:MULTISPECIES: putative 2OG-Fe(II) oxygenase [unclassified Sphingomonas]|uniref:putative 2OG-Fe(II) oxygenase n=1 Tax=unclassified Sphingomonas TaxID=196159 RepID=UPI000928D391|nr:MULTISPECIES: putative 2OG-Fe(II) oxygenase [unclassified Sphingomonas]OJU14720.1 MAG: hypothetical protein BGN95_22745 [Sphingomonas sp. 66-10]